MKEQSLLLSSFFLLLFSSPAQAMSVFDWSWTGSTGNFSGTFTTNETYTGSGLENFTLMEFRVNQAGTGSLTGLVPSPVCANCTFTNGVPAPFFQINGFLSGSINNQQAIGGSSTSPQSFDFTNFVALDSASVGSTSIAPPSVPTPALLPSLLGFGVAAFRKRKLAQSEAD